MQHRKLGANGPNVSAIGLGCMSFAGAFGETDEATSHRCLDAAMDHGINFLDTANIYGMGRSENVLGTWLAHGKRDVVIASKVGIQRDPARPVNNDPAYIRTELEGTLQRLGVDYIDLYYLHRRDETVPLEDSIGTLVDLMKKGKIGGYGLSEVVLYPASGAEHSPLFGSAKRIFPVDAPTRIGNDPGLSRIGRGLCPLFPLGTRCFWPKLS